MMPVGLPRSRRWVPDVQPSGFFKWVSGAFHRTSDVHGWNTGFGRRRNGEHAQIWMEPFTLASHHPCVADLHQQHLGFARQHHCPFQEYHTSIQSKQRYYAFEKHDTHAIFQIRN